MFLQLIRLGIGQAEPNDIQLPATVDWKELTAMALRHSLSAVLMDAYLALSKAGLLEGGRAMDEDSFLYWTGVTMYAFERRYRAHRDAMAHLAAFYNTHGFKMMVLKGYGCNQTWPVPEHRPCGDIDIWNFGLYREADAALSEAFGIEVSNGHHHHTVFRFEDILVENHYDFVNVHLSRSGAEIERVFKELAMDDRFSTDVNGARVYLPSPDLGGLFQLRHALTHFAAVGINVRHVLDWGFYVKRYTGEMNWDWQREMMERFQMTEFYSCLCAVCVEELGFDPAIFPGCTSCPEQKDRMLEDILHPGYGQPVPAKLLPRLAFKFRRWRENAWKRKMCYRENQLAAFLSSLWSHLLKPADI